MIIVVLVVTLVGSCVRGRRESRSLAGEKYNAVTNPGAGVGFSDPKSHPYQTPYDP